MQKKINFHSTKHNFVTVVTLSNSVPIELASKMIGHKFSITQIYARILENRLSSGFSKLDQIIEENKN